MGIIELIKKFRLELPSISHSGIRQPCDIEIRPYCMVLTQINRHGEKNRVLLSETQYFELREEMNATGEQK